jgi:hypothetical protein
MRDHYFTAKALEFKLKEISIKEKARKNDPYLASRQFERFFLTREERGVSLGEQILRDSHERMIYGDSYTYRGGGCS